MKIGVSSAQGGRLANPAAVHAAAVAMEQVGYSSIWVRERAPTPAADDGSLDAIAVLAAIAMVTTRVVLGATLAVDHDTSPAALARTLATLDVLSDGRLAVALQPACCGVGALVDAVDAVWATAGAIAPVQRPRPPLLLATTGAGGLDAVARRADGWQASGVGPAELDGAWCEIKDRAVGYGRDPDRLRLVVRAELALTDTDLGSDRAPYSGSVGQIAADIEALAAAGADEVVLGFTSDVGFDQALDGYARITEAVRP